MPASLLGPGPAWDQALEALAGQGGDDIYFSWRYHALYQYSGARAQAYLYRDQRGSFFLPFLRSPLEGRHFPPGYSDFQTAYGYGGPLADCRQPDFLAAAWQGLAGLAAESGLVAGFLRFHPLLDNHTLVWPPISQAEYNRQTVSLDLGQSPQEVWAAYAPSNRNKISKAQRQGLQVEARQDAPALEVFGGLYHRHMDELQAAGMYHWTPDYFGQIAQWPGHLWRVYLAIHQGQTVGGALLLLGRRLAHYHLSSALTEHRSLAPNNLLRHAAIQDLLGSGWQELHFGGGHTRDPRDPLFLFKRSFSRQQRSFYTGRCVCLPQVYQDLCQQWRQRCPGLAQSHGQQALCYRLEGL